MTLADAIQRAHDANEAKVTAGVPRVSEQLNAEELEHLAAWNRFCSFNGLRNLPGSASCISAFIRAAQKDTDPDKIVLTLAAIERLHNFHSLPNPIATDCVRAEMARVLQIQPPRSWPKAEQLMFASLPAEIRAIIARRERERDIALRRAQNAAAELRQQAAAEAKSATKPNEETKSETQI